MTKKKFVKKLIAGMMAMSIAASALPGGLVASADTESYITGDGSFVQGYGAIVGDEIGSKIVFKAGQYCNYIRVKDPDTDVTKTYAVSDLEEENGLKSITVGVYPKNMDKKIKFEMLADNEGNTKIKFFKSAPSGSTGEAVENIEYSINDYLGAIQTTFPSTDTNYQSEYYKALRDYAKALKIYGEWAKYYLNDGKTFVDENSVYAANADFTSQPDDGEYKTDWDSISYDSQTNKYTVNSHNAHYPSWWTNTGVNNETYWESMPLAAGEPNYDYILSQYAISGNFYNSSFQISYYTTLVLREKIRQIVYVTENHIGDLKDIRITYNDSNGSRTTNKNKLYTYYDASANQRYYYVETEDIGLTDLDKVIKVDFIYNLNNSVSTDTISVSPIGYTKVAAIDKQSGKSGSDVSLYYERNGLANTLRAMAIVCSAGGKYSIELGKLSNNI